MQYVINGRQPLSGTVSVSGAKNSALKLIIAALLCQGTSTIHNVPQIRDTLALVEIINYLGGEAKFIDLNTVQITNKLVRYHLPLEITGLTRTSILLIAPLLHKFGKAIVANPGGCRLGSRSVDRLIDSLIKMGASINYCSADGYYYCELKEPQSACIKFAKSSHTGTDLAIMFASRITKETVIQNAAQEPEINDLIAFLNQADARIVREGTNIKIEGREELNGQTFRVQSDRIEAVTFIILSVLFNGKIKVKNVELSGIAPFLKVYTQIGLDYRYDKKIRQFVVITSSRLKPTDIMTAPHPGFLTDWQPLWVLLMTQIAGESRVHETVFENRFSYIKELRKFGAKVRFWQPLVNNPQELYQFNNYDSLKHRQQAVRIAGPVVLHNAYVTMSDIRAGACLVLAALVAKGKSVVSGAEQIERGYERLVIKLTRLGADISVNDSF